MALSSRVLQRFRPPTGRGPGVACVALWLTTVALPARVMAQEGPPPTAEAVAALVRADSVRAAMAEIRPPNRHPTDAADVVSVPFRVIAAPFHLVLVQLPSWIIGEFTLPRPPGPLVRTIRGLRELGIHPGVSTAIGPRSGPAGTLRFDALDPLALEAAYSVRGSQRYWLGGRTEAGKLRVEAGTGWRRDAQVAFYGIGPSTPDDLTLYRRETLDIGLGGEFTSVPLRLRADIGYEDNLIREPIGGADEPSLLESFDVDGLFGATERLRYVRFGAGAELDLTRRVGFQDRGVRLRTRATRFKGVTGTDSDFHKLRLEAHGLAPLNSRQLLALRARADLTRGSGGSVPFYHLAELGGEETAIGFPDTRFRDLDMVSLIAEWRYEIWRDIHNGVRVESFVYIGEGAVGPRLLKVSTDDWRASYGFGFRAARTQALLGLAFLGFSEEGARFGVSGEWTP